MEEEGAFTTLGVNSQTTLIHMKLKVPQAISTAILKYTVSSSI